MATRLDNAEGTVSILAVLLDQAAFEINRWSVALRSSTACHQPSALFSPPSQPCPPGTFPQVNTNVQNPAGDTLGKEHQPLRKPQVTRNLSSPLRKAASPKRASQQERKPPRIPENTLSIPFYAATVLLLTSREQRKTLLELDNMYPGPFSDLGF